MAKETQLAPGAQLLHLEIGKGRQDVTATALFDMNGHRLRARIKRDSYDFQSSARMERWNGKEWKFLADIHYSKMTTPEKLHYKQDWESVSHFNADLTTLLEKAALILQVN